MKSNETTESPTLLRDRVARHVRDLPRSGIRDFFEVVQSMHDVISLGIGEPDFVTPWHIREAAIYSLERGRTGYTSNLGLPRLRGVITRYVAEQFGIEYQPEREVLVTVGVSEAIDLAIRALVNPGDEVVYHEPCYVSYAPTIALAHGVPVPVRTRMEAQFALEPEVLAAKITPRTKLLLLNFPTNPTGGTLDRKRLEGIARLCEAHDLLVVTDEIYSELTYDDATHTSIATLPGMRDRTLFLHGVSKAFAMTGWRIGFACGPHELIEAMMKVHQYSMLCASIMSQEAAIEALSHGRMAMEKMRREYALRRNYIVGALNEMGLETFLPRGAFYAFPSIRSCGLSSRDFAMGLLQEESVAAVPGSAFGESGEGFLRCSYATALPKIKIAMERMKQYADRLRTGLCAAAS